MLYVGCDVESVSIFQTERVIWLFGATVWRNHDINNVIKMTPNKLIQEDEHLPNAYKIHRCERWNYQQLCKFATVCKLDYYNSFVFTTKTQSFLTRIYFLEYATVYIHVVWRNWQCVSNSKYEDILVLMVCFGSAKIPSNSLIYF